MMSLSFRPPCVWADSLPPAEDRGFRSIQVAVRMAKSLQGDCTMDPGGIDNPGGIDSWLLPHHLSLHIVEVEASHYCLHIAQIEASLSVLLTIPFLLPSHAGQAEV